MGTQRRIIAFEKLSISRCPHRIPVAMRAHAMGQFPGKAGSNLTFATRDGFLLFAQKMGALGDGFDRHRRLEIFADRLEELLGGHPGLFGTDE